MPQVCECSSLSMEDLGADALFPLSSAEKVVKEERCERLSIPSSRRHDPQPLVVQWAIRIVVLSSSLIHRPFRSFINLRNHLFADF